MTENDTYSFPWRGQWVALVPSQLTTLSLPTSSRRTKKRATRNISHICTQRATIRERREIKAEIEKQNQEPEVFMTTSDKVACKTPAKDHSSEELEDKGADNVNQNIV